MNFNTWIATAQTVERPDMPADMVDGGYAIGFIFCDGSWLGVTTDPKTRNPMLSAPVSNQQIWTQDFEDAALLLWDWHAKHNVQQTPMTLRDALWAATACSDLDVALRLPMDVLGVTDGGGAGYMFTGHWEENWASEPRSVRLSWLRQWAQSELGFMEEEI